MTAASAAAAYLIPLAGARKALEDFDRSQAKCRSLMRSLGWIRAESNSARGASSEG